MSDSEEEDVGEKSPMLIDLTVEGKTEKPDFSLMLVTSSPINEHFWVRESSMICCFWNGICDLTNKDKFTLPQAVRAVWKFKVCRTGRKFFWRWTAVCRTCRFANVLLQYVAVRVFPCGSLLWWGYALIGDVTGEGDLKWLPHVTVRGKVRWKILSHPSSFWFASNFGRLILTT